MPMVCRWVQELLGCHFTIFHRKNKIMSGVDAPTRRFGYLISNHIFITSLLSSRDRAKNLHAYDATELSNLGNVKITETDITIIDPTPFLTRDVLRRFSQDSITHSATASPLYPSSSPSITTFPVQMHPSPKLCAILPLLEFVTPNTAISASQIPQSLEIQFLYINDIVGSYTNWGRLHGNSTISWSLQNLFTFLTLSSIFNILRPSGTTIMQTLKYFNSDPTSYIHTTHNINALFVKTADASVVYWLQ